MARFEIPEGWTAQAYRFALDPSPRQVRALDSHCGGARFAFNHMLAHVKAVLSQRDAERSYGIGEQDLTPSQGWTLPALRKSWNQRKQVFANEGTIAVLPRASTAPIASRRPGPRFGGAGVSRTTCAGTGSGRGGGGGAGHR